MVANTSPQRVRVPILNTLNLHRVHNWVQHWIAQEIINDDPYDNEPITEQALYEQLNQLECNPVPFQSRSMLALSSRQQHHQDLSNK